MEITGKVLKLGNLLTGNSARGPWQKQELIIETEEQFPKTVCLQCWGDQAADAAKFEINSVVKAQISIESREFNGKYYTDVRAWRFDNVGQSAPSTPSQNAPVKPNQSAVNQDADIATDGVNDDLPF